MDQIETKIKISEKFIEVSKKGLEKLGSGDHDDARKMVEMTIKREEVILEELKRMHPEYFM